MQHQPTATTRTLALVNQTSILEALKAGGPLSRQQIRARTGLSPATVNRLTAALVAEGSIAEAGREPSTGGRPSVLLRYVGHGRAVIAVHIHGDDASGALVDFEGMVIERRGVTLRYEAKPDDDVADSTESQLALLTGLIDELRSSAELNGTLTEAVGIAVPGIVCGADGTVSRMPGYAWDGVALRRRLREHTGLPVVVENDANSLAFGELHRGHGVGCASLVSLYLDRGFGAGIITNAQLHRGTRAEAGEVGYLLMDRGALDRSDEHYGDLEARIGSAALIRRAREAGIVPPEARAITAEDIFTMAAEGDAAAREIADDVIDMLAIAIGSLVVLIDPELVVIGSSFVETSETIIPAIVRRLTGSIISVPMIRGAALGADAVLVGVSELAVVEASNFAYLVF
jgi:predicted NBD/HSP70 family sugar kinase